MLVFRKSTIFQAIFPKLMMMENWQQNIWTLRSILGRVPRYNGSSAFKMGQLCPKNL